MTTDSLGNTVNPTQPSPEVNEAVSSKIHPDIFYFLKFFSNHASVMLLIDADCGRIVDANQAASIFYGWPCEILRTMNLLDIDAKFSENTSTGHSLLSIGESTRLISSHRKADGALHEVALFTGQTWLDGGLVFLVVVEDISERKHFETLTEFRHRLLEMSDNNSTEELLSFTLDEAERLTGSSLGFFNFISDDGSSILRHACSSSAKSDNCGAATHPKTIDFELCSDVISEKRAVIHNDHAFLRHCNSKFVTHQQSVRELIVPIIRNRKVMATLEIGNKPIDYTQEDIRLVNMLTGVAWDIIARKYAEESEQKMQEAIQYTQKMELIGQLAGGIAHDINNVLMAILGHAEMVIDELEEKSPFAGDLKTIRDSTVRAANLVQQLLAFARKQTIQPTIVLLDETIGKQLPMLREIVGVQIHLVWLPGSSPARVLIDPSQLDQIFTNLCANARDAINGMGTVTIRTSTLRVEQAECYAGHPCLTPGDFVTFSVTDTGCGIDKGTLPHIFEPFFTTKEVGKGTGLGLSTVYGIVRQNMGYLECNSIPGSGTCFCIFLPRYVKELDQPAAATKEHSVIAESRKTILLVDDDPAIVNLIKSVLEKNGYGVLTATTPHDAICIVSESNDTIDLLLTDVVMPEINGKELSVKLLSLIPHLKTLFMSAYTLEAIGLHGIAESELNFIRKPFKLSILTKVIQNILK